MATVDAADGTRIQYQVTGDGSPLLIVHGIDPGHYPHLIEPDRFVERIVAFGAG